MSKKRKTINKRWLLFLSKSFFDIALFFSSAFLGVYLALHFNEPIDKLGVGFIIFIISSWIIKASIEYQIDNKK